MLIFLPEGIISGTFFVINILYMNIQIFIMYMHYFYFFFNIFYLNSGILSSFIIFYSL